MAIVHESEDVAMPTGVSTGANPAGAMSNSSYVEWGAVAAGAIASLAVSFVLLTFGAGVGLSAVSPWTASPTITAIAVGSAFWVLLVLLWSSALGGYLAARLRHPWRGAPADEGEFRDKAHGLLSWALAVVVAAIVASASISGRSMGDSTLARSAASNTAVDTIVRTPRAEVIPASDALRAEVGRVFATNIGKDDLAAGDKQYLVGLYSNRTGANAADADRTVTAAFRTFKDTVNRARKAGVVMAFIAAASLLAGAAAAWWAAGLGGEHREKGTVWEVFRRHDHPAFKRRFGP